MTLKQRLAELFGLSAKKPELVVSKDDEKLLAASRCITGVQITTSINSEINISPLDVKKWLNELIELRSKTLQHYENERGK